MTLSDALHAYGQLYQLAVPLLYMWAQPEIVNLLEEEKRVRNQVIVSGKALDVAFCTGRHQHDHNHSDNAVEKVKEGNEEGEIASREKFIEIVKNEKKK